MSTPRRYTEADLVALLRAKYAPPGYAFFAQVPNRTGGATRRADAIAMSVWRSRGLEILGFEVKVSRADWLTELRTPEKCETLARYCDRWYLVVPSEDLLREGELPATWGLQVVAAGRLRTVKEAPHLSPQALSREFVAAILRLAADNQPGEQQIRAAVSQAVEQATRELREKRAAELERERDVVRMEVERYRQVIQQFEAASGVTLPLYNGGRIGNAVHLVLHGGLERQRAELEALCDQAERTARFLAAVKAETDARTWAAEPQESEHA